MIHFKTFDSAGIEFATLPTFPTLLSLFFYEEGVIIYKANPRISWMHKQPPSTDQIKPSSSGIRVDVAS